MRKSIMLKVGAVGTTFAMAGALAIAASGTTGAYFSETQVGGITGTPGAVHLNTSATTFAWTNMMPGEQNSAKVDFTNTGTGAQDFYLVFQNATALSALNDLGTYGEAHVSVNGVEKFASANLTDHWADLSVGQAGVPLTHALPAKILLASNVTKDSVNSFEFDFKYDGRIGNGTSGGVGVFNSYPVSGQTTKVPGETGAGLPFSVVAVQVGQQP